METSGYAQTDDTYGDATIHYYPYPSPCDHSHDHCQHCWHYCPSCGINYCCKCKETCSCNTITIPYYPPYNPYPSYTATYF